MSVFGIKTMPARGYDDDDYYSYNGEENADDDADYVLQCFAVGDLVFDPVLAYITPEKTAVMVIPPDLWNDFRTNVYENYFSDEKHIKAFVFSRFTPTDFNIAVTIVKQYLPNIRCMNAHNLAFSSTDFHKLVAEGTGPLPPD